jgi:transposase
LCEATLFLRPDGLSPGSRRCGKVSQRRTVEKLICVKRKSVWPLQRVLEAIFYLTKNCIIWRDLPEVFPPWQTVYWYFRKWSRNDTWMLIANERGRPLGLRRGELPKSWFLTSTQT